MAGHSVRSVLVTAAAPTAILLGSIGCENAGQGALTGGGVGALSGLAIGSLSGNAGAGAAIGAIAGAAGGAVIGDQNRRANEREAAEQVRFEQERADARERPSRQQEYTAPTDMTDADRDRVALGRLEGRWTMVGWSELISGERTTVSGTAVGSVFRSYYINLDVTAEVENGSDETSMGTLLLGSEPGRGVTLESRFDNAPSPSRFVGRSSSDRTVFTLDEERVSVDGVRRQIVIRFVGTEAWNIEVRNLAASGRPLVGSFTFTLDR